MAWWGNNNNDNESSEFDNGAIVSATERMISGYAASADTWTREDNARYWEHGSISRPTNLTAEEANAVYEEARARLGE